MANYQFFPSYQRSKERLQPQSPGVGKQDQEQQQQAGERPEKPFLKVITSGANLQDTEIVPVDARMLRRRLRLVE